MNRNFFIRAMLREIGSRKTSSLQVILAVALGTGAVLAVHSYREQLSKAILNEAKNILGADLIATSSSPLTDDQKAFLGRILPNGTKSSELVQFPSMLRNPETQDSALSLVKAIKGEYPYFGDIVTSPPGLYRKLKPGEVLLEESLIKNLKLKVGDSVQLGESVLRLKGQIIKEPGLAGSFMSMAPSSILHKNSLEATGLEQRGSRISYQNPILLPTLSDASVFKKSNFKEFAKNDLILYESTEANSGSQKFLANTLDFFSLLALCAFFLGGISILLSSRAGIRTKANALAIYKCLGASPNLVVTLVLGELLLLATIGAILGFVLGIFVQYQIPNLASKEFLFQPEMIPSAKTLLWGFVLAWVVPLASAWDSLAKTRTLSPLYALRTDFADELDSIPKFEIRQMISFITVYLVFFGLAWWETGDWIKGILLCSLLLFLPLLIYVGTLFIRKVLSFALNRFEFSPSIRMALRKLDRPRTGLSWVSVGLGSSLFVLLLSLFVSDSLLEYSGAKDKERRPNMFVLDIRPEQLDFFLQSASNHQADKLITSPIIGARLARINGEAIKKEELEESALRRDWRSTARTREYFLSYRETPYPTEKVSDGDFWRKGEEDQISVEKEFSKNLKVELGDKLTFSIGGVEVTGIIRNFRTVNWSDMRPNFVVIFSRGILEKAPKFFLSSFRIESPEERYSLQKELLSEFPNLTVIDTEKAVQSFLGILEKISFAIRWMTGLIVVSSLLLILASLELSRKERLEETSLLRILGGTKAFLGKYFLGEALVLSHAAFLLAFGLVWIASSLLSNFIFEIESTVPWLEVAITYFATNLSVVAMYFTTLRGEWDRSPTLYLKEV
ncbi:efflux ABC transporter, permease protein [Leptospira broomii serovar Hurstbridge str. 5399]|uniref:Efflux ABC transporter, permease protein n=1 Tax=Leptospira broomii serovar Hurstbridge str. 5399 TaxID=1049789 RepID=T0GGA0_9LEPT|nr:efflux ABC transporter, permease protein [Leptospira broomii serovar Hurstbridge str. 5399]